LLYVEGTSAYPTTNILENTYYLLTDNPDLAPDKYALAQLDATVGDPPVEGLVSYLQDPKYCRESSDCLYRANFCEIDAFNRYHQYFTPWGCGPATYVGLGDSLSLEESLGCASNESVEVKPDSLECRESRCVAVNPVPSCVRNP
jgi:hypothetical protein